MNLYKKLNEVLNYMVLEFIEMERNRYFYLEIRKMFDVNPALPRDNDFFWWIYQNHIYSSLLSIRRLTDDNPDCQSLVKFLRIIFSNPSLLSRNYFISIYHKGDEKEANRIFDVLVGKEKKNVDPKEVKVEIDLLKVKYDRFEEFINRRVVHADKRKVKIIPKTRDLDDLKKYIEQLIMKYKNILNGENESKPNISYSDEWKNIFKIPWIESE